MMKRPTFPVIKYSIVSAILVFAVLGNTAGDVLSGNYTNVDEMIMACESYGRSNFYEFSRCYTANYREFMVGSANSTVQSLQEEFINFTNALALSTQQRKISDRSAQTIFRNARAKLNEFGKTIKNSPSQYDPKDASNKIYNELNSALEQYNNSSRLFTAMSAEERQCVGDLNAYAQQDKLGVLERNLISCKRQIADRNAAITREREASLAAEREKARQAAEAAQQKAAQQEQLRQAEIARQKRAKEAYERCMADAACRTQRERAQAEWRAMLALGLYPKKLIIEIYGVRQQCEVSGNWMCMKACEQMADIVDNQVRAMTGTGILPSTSLEFKLPGMEEMFAGALKQCVDISRQ